jgi:hypothetical protein
LASVATGTPYELISEAFAETGGDPGSDIVRDFLKRFGVDKPLKVLAANMNTAANTSSPSTSKPKETAGAFQPAGSPITSRRL